MAKVDWASVLEEESAEDLWNGLYQLVSRHPVVRPLHYSSDGAAVASRLEINADLTQELFLHLLQKQRFEYYVESGYTSTEIENELVYIELPNLVGARLRNRYPESFRMARRVSSLLKDSSRFRRVSRKDSVRPELPLAAEAGVQPAAPLLGDIEEDRETESRVGRQTNGSGHQRMVNQVYALREWRSSKPIGDPGRFEDRVRDVPMRQRDIRIVGRSGTSQLIISNRDLEDLIVEILRAIDSPADVRTIRHLALSRIPLQDYRVGSLDEAFTTDDDAGKPIVREASDTRPTPESELLNDEHSRTVRRIAADFLSDLRRKVNNNQKRYDRLVQTMWHVYFDPLAPSQIEIASKLGVSDSLVSDNRRLIDYELKKLQLSRDEGFVFSEHLRQLVAAAVD
ncbi:MAG TPA: hypothetical protein VFV34_10315 [Blastocatellia bacterium]|nr:hypothetical protein [Blastocatellia bacterium]